MNRGDSPAADLPSSTLPLAAFDKQPRTRLVFGDGTLERIGALARELGGTRVLLVTDPGIRAAGHADRAAELLRAAGLEVSVFDQVRENPTTLDVARCLALARLGSVDLLVGLGGGSSLDTAKGCNFLLTNGGEMKDYWGVGKARHPMLPMIAVPTTAGTGSECQSAALIADEHSHQKMACLDPKAAARVAILDPRLTLSQPHRVTALTGLDAIAHSVETAVTKPRNAVSVMYSRQAFKLCIGSFSPVLAHPGNLDARGRMLLGAAFAGLAIEHSMLGAAHSAANPLTAHFNVVHGLAVGIMLPAVVRFNAVDPAAAEGYLDLAVGVLPDVHQASSAGGEIARWIEVLLQRAGLPTRLRDVGVGEASLPALAAEAARQWTANFNPRPVTATEFHQLYEAAL